MLLHFVLCLECNVCFLVVVQYFYKKMGEEKYDSVEGSVEGLSIAEWNALPEPETSLNYLKILNF